MARAELTEAGQLLRAVTDDVPGPLADRLAYQADQLESLAARDRGPDHGRLARHQQALRDIAADATDDAVVEAVSRANDRIDAYRETIEGV